MEAPPAEYKHLILVANNQPIIRRTVLQLKLYEEAANIIVVAPNSFRAYIPIDIKVIQLEESTDSVLERIWECLKFVYPDSHTPVTFILGDVIFSHAMMKDIMQNNAYIKFYGRAGENMVTGKKVGEIFALDLKAKGQRDFILQLIARMIRRGYAGDYSKTLWGLYRKTIFSYDPFYELPGDYTDDIDSIEEYIQFGEQLINATNLEDNK